MEFRLCIRVYVNTGLKIWYFRIWSRLAQLTFVNAIVVFCMS